MDCPPVALWFDTLGEELERKEVFGRSGLTDGPDCSTDGLERYDVVGRLWPNEVSGRLGLTDGATRSTDGLGRLNDVFGRLGLMEGPGETDGARLLAMRSCRPPPEKLCLGAEGAIAEGPRLNCGLGEDRKDGPPADPPRFIIEGCDRICGAACVLGAWLLMPEFWREPPPLSRLRDWPPACGPSAKVNPSTTAKTQKPQAHFFALWDPASRE